MKNNYNHYYIIQNWLLNRVDLIKKYAPDNFEHIGNILLQRIIEQLPKNQINFKDVDDELINYLDDNFVILCVNLFFMKIMLTILVFSPFIFYFFDYISDYQALLTSILLATGSQIFFNMKIQNVIVQLLVIVKNFDGKILKNN